MEADTQVSLALLALTVFNSAITGCLVEEAYGVVVLKRLFKVLGDLKRW